MAINDQGRVQSGEEAREVLAQFKQGNVSVEELESAVRRHATSLGMSLSQVQDYWDRYKVRNVPGFEDTRQTVPTIPTTPGAGDPSVDDFDTGGEPAGESLARTGGFGSDAVDRDEAGDRDETPVSTSGRSPMDILGMAEFIRADESATIPGRRTAYNRAMDLSPWVQSLSPSARYIANRWFDPMSARYTLAAAPESLGGGAWERSEEVHSPEGSTFYDFTQRPTDYGEIPPSGGVGDWTGGVPSTTEPQFGYTQPATGGTSWAPWTSDQYANRFQGMNIGQFEWSPEERAIQVGGGAVPTHGQQEALDFLGAMEPEEAEQIISSAAMAGINPIASRYAGPQLSKAFSAFEQQSPDIGGGEMFRRYVASEPWKTGRWIPTASTWDLY